MRTSIARAVLAGALLASAGAARAQLESYKPKETMSVASWAVSVPVGSFSKDFVDRTSWRGIGFDTRSRMWDRISLGVGIDYARFEDTFSLVSVPAGNGGTLSGPLYRFADQFTLRGLVHAYFPVGPVVPYGGVGIGAVWSYGYQQTSDYQRSQNSMALLVAPEAGLSWPFAKGASSTGLNLAVRWNWSQASFLTVTNAQTVQVLLGLFAAY